MIQKYVDRFIENKSQLETVLSKKHPDDYKELVTEVIKLITSDDYGDLNYENIHEIVDGDYQGTLLYIIPTKTSGVGKYWSVKVSYGSCSGCDTLQGIRNYQDDLPTKNQINEYMTLALHIVQNLKEV